MVFGCSVELFKVCVVFLILFNKLIFIVLFEIDNYVKLFFKGMDVL